MAQLPDKTELHNKYLTLALEEAQKCVPTPTAFCVGCAIVVNKADGTPSVLATGYSRELPGNTHAEANALAKAQLLSQEDLRAFDPKMQHPSIDHLLSVADVYTTLEPCSVRTSGLAPCADALIEAGIRRCIIGVGEPDDFVNCEGASKLKDAGVEVIWLSGLEEQCLAVARRGHLKS
ncbi:hypothetical protein D9619_005642 [Psilocybe cf. subviscida]|uniref:CMP/dCMP-type deaminase domain-containing protein n=1 Tax=Psilocybe cf. subviscida TaxID=2480587 RepID=A0A8H5FBB7_9AGAR|nr:hypothetical protein D9619_005642 [Psilocybe cf. subviscida]